MTAPSADALRHALESGEIVPYFQPLVDLRNGDLAGFEVLARWCPPGRPVVLPDAFIPLAEESGLIGALGEQVLGQACAAAAEWPAPVTLAVNISPLQLRVADLADRLRRVTDSARFAPERLVFEITEAAFIGDIDLARGIACALKALGAQLALDDFGVGHSGLRLLQNLPIDRLKLDASFVRAMTYHRESRKIVAAVIGLGQSLGLSTIAEGVECRAQADMLACLGCDTGQGWLFGAPVPAPQAAALIGRPPSPSAAGASMGRIAEEVALRLEALPNQCLGQLQALYDGAPVGLGFLDPQLRYRAVNERLAAIHGRPVAEHLGRSVAEIIPDLFDRVAPQLRRAMSGEAVIDCLVRQSGNDADGRTYLASYQPVHDPAGELNGVSVAVVDLADCELVRRNAAPAAADGNPAPPKLTPRQWQVLRLLAAGQSVKEIARRLGLAPGTVKTHLAHLYTALGVRNRVEAVMRMELLHDRGHQP